MAWSKGNKKSNFELKNATPKIHVCSADPLFLKQQEKFSFLQKRQGFSELR